MKYPDDKRQQLLSKVFWDYNLDIKEIIKTIDNDTITHNKKQIFVRCLQRLPWHNVVGIFGFDAAKTLLTNDVIEQIWPKERREHFATLQKLLRGEPLPAARWDSELREKLKSTVLSYRWYRTQ